MIRTKKNDFIELKFTGYTNGEIFDSNIEEDLKRISKDAKPSKLIVAIGNSMVVPGLDKALEDKELNKQYEISFSCVEGFGERNRHLIKTIPLKAFTQQKIAPQPGMVLALDGMPVKIIAVSGARVTADFNNFLAGKELKYKFTITRKIEGTREKAEALFQFYLNTVPEIEIKENELIVKGPIQIKAFIEVYKDKFKELLNIEPKFEEKEEVVKEVKNAIEEKEESN